MARVPSRFKQTILISFCAFVINPNLSFNEDQTFMGAVSGTHLSVPPKNSLENNLRIVTNFLRRNRHGQTTDGRTQLQSFHRRTSKNTSHGSGIGTMTEVELPDAAVDLGAAGPELRRVEFGIPPNDAIEGRHTTGRRSATAHKKIHRKLTKHCAKESGAKATVSTTKPADGAVAPGNSGDPTKVPPQTTTTAASAPAQPPSPSPSPNLGNKEGEDAKAPVPPLPQPSIDAAAAMKPAETPQPAKSAPPVPTVQQPAQPLFPPSFPSGSGPPGPGPAFPSFPAPLHPQPMEPPSGGILPKSSKSNLIIGGSKMPNFKLIYFDARGLCEPIRLLFHYAKVPFDDSRISRKQWLALKDSTVFGKLPILEVDGKPLTYCHTISRYLARTFGMAGEDSWEEAKVDEVADFHADVANDLQPYMYVVAGFHQGDKNTLRTAIFLPGVEKNFPVYVQLLKQSGSGFFMPSGVTWVDLVIAEYMTTVKHFEPQILDKYPALNKFIHKIQTLPPIIDYVTTREHQPI